MKKRITGFLVISVTYALAFLVAFLVGTFFRTLHPLLVVLFSDIAATIVVYIISSIYNNTSIYDPYWSVAPVFIAFYYILFSPYSGNFIRRILVLTLTAIWATRLTWHWARGWEGLKDEDWRYTLYRKEHKKIFWVINLFGLQLMPTIAVYLASLSLYPALFIKGTPFNLLDITGIIVTATAIIIEAVADNQLQEFIQQRESKEKIMKQGLWHYSRHPNYFGEILFWFGLYFFALATDIHFWWTIIGPIFILLLFYFISIPLMDQRNLSRRPEYEEHMQKVSKLFLLPPKENNSSQSS